MTQKILLIEDEQNIIAAISFILARDGWDVRAHSNGATALDEVIARKPALVILDMMLPGRSGLDILKDIRAHPQIGQTPVLMLTAKGQKSDQENAELAGADQFMTKPFSNAEVLQAVRALVQA